METVELHSVLTCPECGHESEERMPPNGCQVLYECVECGAEVRPRDEDCCVFCSYGTIPCPPVQTEEMIEFGDYGM